MHELFQIVHVGISREIMYHVKLDGFRKFTARPTLRDEM
jgi:hypothetical protein